RGLPPPAIHRPARRRQDDAGPPAARPPPAAGPRRRLGGDARSLRGRPPAAVRAGEPATLPRPPPRCIARLPHRRRLVVAAAGRSLACPRRRALSRQDGRVPDDRPRLPPPAPGGRRGPSVSSPGHGELPGPVPSGRRHQPVPVRTGRPPGHVPVQRALPGPLRPPLLRPPPRPLRP